MPKKTVSRLTFSLYPHEIEVIRLISRQLAWKLGVPQVPLALVYRQAIQALIEREGLTIPLILDNSYNNNHDSK